MRTRRVATLFTYHYFVHSAGHSSYNDLVLYALVGPHNETPLPQRSRLVSIGDYIWRRGVCHSIYSTQHRGLYTHQHSLSNSSGTRDTTDRILHDDHTTDPLHSFRCSSQCLTRPPAQPHIPLSPRIRLHRAYSRYSRYLPLHETRI